MNTSTLSRRTLLGGVAVGAAALSLSPNFTPRASAAQTVHIAVSPHPDDEWLRGAGRFNWVVNQGGIHLVLLALTDGGGTAMGRREGLTPAQVCERRAAEQTGSWSALTYGRGEIIRAGIADGGLTVSNVKTAISNVLNIYPGAEVFVCAHDTDDTADHLTTVRAARELAVEGATPVFRYLRDPRYSGGATGAQRPPDPAAAEAALRAYWWTLGPTSSVASIRNATIRSGYLSRYTR